VAAADPDALIVRTAWVYAAAGQNFVNTMLRLMREREEVKVVADQIGTPTYATSLAQALWALARTGGRGILHYTDSGVASWYDFACAIQEEALAVGLLKKSVPI
jgi:dTDP-4-dehydrorhamnose reductase